MKNCGIVALLSLALLGCDSPEDSAGPAGGDGQPSAGKADDAADIEDGLDGLVCAINEFACLDDGLWTCCPSMCPPTHYPCGSDSCCGASEDTRVFEGSAPEGIDDAACESHEAACVDPGLSSWSCCDAFVCPETHYRCGSSCCSR